MKRLLALVLCPFFVSCSTARAILYSYDEPEWTSSVKLADGAVLVADDQMVLNALLAEPGRIPEATIPAEPIETMFRAMAVAAPGQSFYLNKLEEVGVEGALRGPGGVLLSETHIAYLRGKFGFRDVQLFNRQLDEDSVIVIDGAPVGILRPLKPAPK
jgi:hypothetical protein